MKKIFILVFFILLIVLFLFYFIFGTKENIVIKELSTLTTSSTKYEIHKSVRVPILVYHNIRDFKINESNRDKEFVVSAQNFEKQMGYLYENNFQTIFMKDLDVYFKGGGDLPENPIIITFDDGVVSQYENAFPILKKYNQFATFFVFTNAMDRNINYMNWEQLSEMVDYGMEIGSHTNLHPFLTKIRTNTEFDKEIIFSKSEIKKYLDYDVVSFAYPFGDYNEEVVVRLKDAGYTSARGIVDGSEHSKDGLFKLKSYFSTSNFERFKRIVE
ncbi:MAG: polysaccharide deacetylase family protein [Candidatus Magasanikbacteria bacterium]|nr:polysaccharide deacetylase family protein [Candidatus Magasanikbacteria bacterium]